MNETEIFGLDIRPYILSSLSARASGSGYVLEPQNSRLSFDFSSFEGKIKIDLVSKRISGNGRLLINNQEVTVLSKISHRTELELEKNKVIDIVRDNSASGKLIVCGFTITRIDDDGRSVITVDKMPENWKKTLSRCGHIKGVRLVGDQLLAVEGGSIQRADVIETIITNPPNAFVIGDNVKFIFPCEIVDISLKTDLASLSPLKPIYKHIPAPPKLGTKDDPAHQNKYTQSVVFPNGIQNVTGSKNNAIIYDSYSSGLKPDTLHNTANLVGNFGNSGKGILLNKDAKFSIPVSNLQPYTQYVVVATLRKMSGNGKISICFTSSDGNQRSVTSLICPDKLVELYIKLHSEYEPHVGSSYFLTLFRPEGTNIGEIYIERLMIIHGITRSHQRGPYIPETAPTLNENSGYIFFGSELEHPVISTAKKYSINTPQMYDKSLFDKTSTVTINSLSSMKWYLKVKNLCPNINLKNNTGDESVLLMSSLGSLKKCNNLWLDVFDGGISDSDNEILNGCKLIATPSFDNLNLLKSKYKNVIYLEKPWPYIAPKQMPLPVKDYIFAIHRKNSITKRLFESWTNDMPPLLIVGYRGEVPDHVYVMNEYIGYDNMLYAMLNAKLIIDLPEHNNYLSGFLSLANSFGIPTITSNWQGLFNNAKFIVSKDTENNISIPTKEMLSQTIIETLSNYNLTENTLNKHNDKLNNFLSTIF